MTAAMTLKGRPYLVLICGKEGTRKCALMSVKRHLELS